MAASAGTNLLSSLINLSRILSHINPQADPRRESSVTIFRKVYCSYIYKEWISKQINSYIFHLNCFVILFLIGRWDKIWNCKIPSIRWQSKMKSHWTHIISTVQNINTYWFAIIYSIKQALKKGLLQSL